MGTNDHTTRNRGLYGFGLLLTEKKVGFWPLTGAGFFEYYSVDGYLLMQALALRRRVLVVPLRLVHVFPLHPLGCHREMGSGGASKMK